VTRARRTNADVKALLGALQDAGVEFCVIGGVAAIAHGALTPTQDLDVAAPMTVENLSRLLAALAPYHPKHATRPDLGVITASAQELTHFRLLLLDTDLGRLDVLKTVEPIGEFDQLHMSELSLVSDQLVRVITLDQLIEVKAHLRRPKDKIVESELRAIRDRLHDPA
jgi:predicted nucleotidyltransferase